MSRRPSRSPTPSTSRSSTGSLNFVDGSGATIAEGVFNTGTIEPGATTTEEIPGANIYEPVPEVTCELTEVKSDEPA